MSTAQRRRLARLEARTAAGLNRSVLYAYAAPPDLPEAEALKMLGWAPRPQDDIFCMEILEPGEAPRPLSQQPP
ncbi:MAG: hypothetical protein JNK21_01355 [Rhodospirillaceae bacterium]|nr:hypothetical protein [Rhodospirillaceae bacterium]